MDTWHIITAVLGAYECVRRPVMVVVEVAVMWVFLQAERRGRRG